MQDRVSLHPGRVKLVPVAGQENTYDMVRADSPTQEGTPLNKDSLLKDATAALLGGDSSMLPDEALVILKTLVDNAQTSADEKAKIQTGSYIGTGTYGSKNPNTLTFDFEPKLLIVSGTVNGHTSTKQVYGVTVIYIEGQNEYGFLVQTNAGYVNGNVYRDGNTISWYSTDTSSNYAPGLQFNISGKTYSYIAFG